MQRQTSPAKRGDVVSIRAHASYRPSHKTLSQDRIVAARETLGLSRAEFADYLSDVLGWSVTADAVKRWETIKAPPGDALMACWSAGAVLDEATPEAITAYAARGDVTREQWNGIIDGCTEHLWLYGMAEAAYATDDAVPVIFAKAAEAGADIRVLLLSPDYPRMDTIDYDERAPGGTLAARIRSALARFSAMRDEIGPQMQIRVYDTHPSVSIVRGDNHMLVTPYLKYMVGNSCPTLEFTEGSAAQMFDRYDRHFQSMWPQAKDWT
jgi:DNA-binding transcriptional regulator YiaG